LYICVEQKKTGFETKILPLAPGRLLEFLNRSGVLFLAVFVDNKNAAYEKVTYFFVSAKAFPGEGSSAFVLNDL
jgi:hypothetical protein